MHPTTPFHYDPSEINYEHTHLAMYPWGSPSVVTVGEHHMHHHSRHDFADEILRRNIIQDWLEDWVVSDGAATRQKEIMELRSRTSLPWDLTKIPSAPVHSACRYDSKSTTVENTSKRSHYQRRKALEKEVNWRNQMTMTMIES
uniref:Uncharacterized protein n=1 Tax=Leptocylindrus danicus TaxID=163516 RepID=A0A7S2K0H9_9STRA|mmetsp:Transcript_15425/g.22798  ORF Transcript_15425/g.22798 Transcript_15425/m.22798 type:complete len:144 (+) Transcript_15425:111-542(+)